MWLTIINFVEPCGEKFKPTFGSPLWALILEWKAGLIWTPIMVSIIESLISVNSVQRLKSNQVGKTVWIGMQISLNYFFSSLYAPNHLKLLNIASEHLRARRTLRALDEVTLQSVHWKQICKSFLLLPAKSLLH